MDIDPSQMLQTIAQNPETAKAVKEFGSIYFGGAGHNLVGLLGGDWLYYTRLENIAKLANGVRKRLKARGVTEPQQVSLALGLPLLKEAADENRDEIRELWERLLASALDPTRTRSVRRTFIEAVKSMDPVDALFFRDLMEERWPKREFAEKFAAGHHIRPDEALLSALHLAKIDCILQTPGGGYYNYRLTLFGKELAEALKD